MTEFNQRYSNRNIPQQTLRELKARLSLRAPQAESLDKLALSISTAPEMLSKAERGHTTSEDESSRELNQQLRQQFNQQVLQKLKQEFPTLEDFERDFPSLCFSLATGVGKTRLMGAFIAYLHTAYGINNFFVLAPNLTIYEKLIQDFTPNTPKYVFGNLMEFNFQSPTIITGDNYDSRDTATASLLGQVRINVFNISKINSEVRGGKEPRIKRMREVLGESYFNHLANLPDLVLLMDESHRYRASAGIKAINELNPLLGLEVTATPFVESTRAPIPFKNVIMDYPLARAMEDGFVKEPAVVTQRGFDPKGLSDEQLESIKLKDGIRLHEHTKVHLLNYAQNTGQKLVKPFVLIVARDTTHAGELKDKIQSDEFFNGQYKDKVIQVDSSTKEEEITRRLLAVEDPNEPTEIVIHVNMLKEGWDVTNLYTIIPLRAANARTLIEQTIGRGLRLPYGKRTGVEEVDRLSIVAHDRFQEIIDEANRDDSIIRLKAVILDAEKDDTPMTSIKGVSKLSLLLGQGGGQVSPSVENTLAGELSTLQNLANAGQTAASDNAPDIPNLESPVVQRAVQVVQAEIQRYASRPDVVKHSQDLSKPTVQQELLAQVRRSLRAPDPVQQSLDSMGTDAPELSESEVAEIVEQVTQLHIKNTIDIPRVVVTPSEDIQTGFNPFTLNTQGLHLQPNERELMGQNLRDHQIFSIKAQEAAQEKTPEDRLVYALIDFDDIDYFTQAELLYDLAKQMTDYFRSYLTEEEVGTVVEQNYQLIANNIHAQMQPHYWEKASSYHVEVSKSFVPLKEPHYTVAQEIPVQSIRNTPTGKVSIKRLVFGGFSRCLFELQKFDSDTERRFAVILERDSLKWFKPAKGQFQIYYQWGAEQPEYVPDFVVETADCFMLAETKARSELASKEVEAKAEAAKTWCNNASTVSLKPWHYVVVPHDEVKENLKLEDYLRFRC